MHIRQAILSALETDSPEVQAKVRPIIKPAVALGVFWERAGDFSPVLNAMEALVQELEKGVAKPDPVAVEDSPSIIISRVFGT